MFAVNEMILAIRMIIHDTDKVKYTDEQILSVINAGNRFIWRQIKNIRPQMLIETHSGALPVGCTGINLPDIPAKMVDVYVGGQQITAVNFLELDQPMRTGVPYRYYLDGFQTLCFYPVPEVDLEYRVRFIRSASVLGMDGQSGLSDDLDDFLIEYVRIRLSLDDFLPQETQLLQVLSTKIHDHIKNIEEPQTAVNGYFDSPVRGYW